MDGPVSSFGKGYWAIEHNWSCSLHSSPNRRGHRPLPHDMLYESWTALGLFPASKVSLAQESYADSIEIEEGERYNICRNAANTTGLLLREEP